MSITIHSAGYTAKPEVTSEEAWPLLRASARAKEHKISTKYLDCNYGGEKTTTHRIDLPNGSEIHCFMERKCDRERRLAREYASTPGQVAITNLVLGFRNIAGQLVNQKPTERACECNESVPCLTHVAAVSDRLLNSPEAQQSLMHAEHAELSAGEMDMAGPENDK